MDIKLLDKISFLSDKSILFISKNNKNLWHKTKNFML